MHGTTFSTVELNNVVADDELPFNRKTNETETEPKQERERAHSALFEKSILHNINVWH